MSNDLDSSDDEVATEIERIPPFSGFLQRYQEADAGPSKKEWTKVWCVLENRKLLYYKSKIDPTSPELAEGYVELVNGGKVSLKKIKNSKCGLNVSQPLPSAKGLPSSITVEFKADSDGDALHWERELKKAIAGKVHQYPKDIAKRASQVKLEQASSNAHQSLDSGNASDLSISDPEVKQMLQDARRKLKRMVGTLRKKGAGTSTFGRKNWKSRTFDLRDGQLRYYSRKDCKPASLKGSIELEGCSIEEVSDGKTAMFIITHPVRRHLVCQAESEDEMNLWVSAVQASINVENSGRQGKSKTRRQVIANESVETTPKAKSSQSVPKSREAKKAINGALQRHFLFRDIPDHTELINTMQPKWFAAGDVIVWQGAPGDLFYVVEEGVCEVVKNDDHLATFGQNSAFGELALLHHGRRAATIRAFTAVKTWTVDRRAFRMVLKSASATQDQERLQFLQEVNLLKPLSVGELQAISGALKTTTFSNGEYIIKQGDVGDCFYIVKEGEVAFSSTDADTKKEMELSKCGVGECFGEIALMRDEPRKVNAKAVGSCHCYCLERSDFEQLLGSLTGVMDMHIGLNLLRKVKEFQNMDEKEMETVAKALTRGHHQDGEFIIKQEGAGDKFYIIEKGFVKIMSNGAETARLGAGKYFGEISLLRDEPAVADVIADGPVEVMYLSASEFASLMGPLEKILQREAEKRKEQTVSSRFKNIFKKEKSSSNVAGEKVVAAKAELPDIKKITELKQLQTLGTGSFGRVKLVHHPPSDLAAALKIMQKEEVVSRHQVTNVTQEVAILRQIDHPFILKLLGTFQDRDCLYMLLELVPGGEMWTLLHGDLKLLPSGPSKGLRNDDAVFYSAMVASAVKYMHELKIAYRDMKPENLVVDGRGYLKVVDFGFAKVIEPQAKAHTLCGTPDYLAPELVLGRGHSHAVDHWALGILVYELLSLQTPFEDDDSNRIMENVAKYRGEKALKFPRGFGPLAEDFIKKLLNPNPTLRLGSLKGGVSEILRHGWFGKIDWDALENGLVDAPYKPNITDKLKPVNFDDFEGDIDPPIIPYHGQETFKRF